MSRRYEFDFTARVVVNAENVAQALRHAKRLKLTGATIAGMTRPRNNRVTVKYSSSVASTSIKLTAIRTGGQP